MDYQDALKEALKQDLIKRGIPLKDSQEGSFPSKNSQEGEYENSLREALKQDLIKRGIPINEEVSKEQDSESFRWPRFLSEHAAKGVLDTADFVQHSPHLLGKGVEYLFPPDVSMIGKAGKYLAESTKPKRPISEETKEALIRDYGFDLDSQGEGNTPLQRIAGHGARFAGGTIVPIPGAGALRALPKTIAASGAIGAGSGALQEVGVPGLPADIAAVVGGGLAHGLARRSASRLTGEEKHVAKNLQEFVGERELPETLTNLSKKPTFPESIPGYEPTTAELANNTALSQIHDVRYGAPKSGIADQAGRQNDAMWKVFDKESLERSTTPDIIESVGEEYNKRKITRHKKTHEGYESIKKNHDKLTPSNLIKFLKDESPNDIIGDLNPISRNLNIPKKISKSEKEYKKIYDMASQDQKKKMEPPITEANVKISKLAAIDKFLTKKMQKFKRSGEFDRRKTLELAQKELRKDLDSASEVYKNARSEYARLSGPVNEIEEHLVLGKIPDGKFNNVMNMLFKNTEGKSSSLDNIKQLRKVFGEDSKKWKKFQHATTNHIRRKIINSGKQGHNNTLSYDAMRKFLDEHGEALKHVYNNDQMKVVDSLFGALDARNTASRLGESKGSATNPRAMINKTLARGMGMKGLEFATKLATFRSPLAGGLEYVTKNRKKNLLGILDKSLREPEFAHKLLNHDFKSNKGLNAFINTALTRTPELTRNRKDEERTGVTRNGKTFPYTLKAKQD